MIFEQDVPIFPHGIVVEGQGILDPVSGQKIPLNGTALFVLSRVDGNRTVEDLARLVAARYGVRAEKAVSDILHSLDTTTADEVILEDRVVCRDQPPRWIRADGLGSKANAGYR